MGNPWTAIRRSCNPAKLWCKVDVTHARLQFKDGADFEVVSLAGYGLVAIGGTVETSVGPMRVIGIGDDGVIQMEPLEG